MQNTTGLHQKEKLDCANIYDQTIVKKKDVKDSFDDLIKYANFKYIFLSYNNEGLMSSDEIKTVLNKYGHYDLATTEYQRFRADKKDSRNHKANSTVEYLHILEKI